MTTTQAIILGLIQGLTEFLPVSSSGHLVLFQQLLDIGFDSPVLFELVVHLGTLLAIGLVYRHDLLDLIKFGCYQGWTRKPADKNFIRYWREDERGWLIIMVIAATIPTAIIGKLFEEDFESLFSEPFAVGIALLITGTLLIISRFSKEAQKDTILSAPLWMGIAIGTVQAMAITPGISRSGSTIAIALLLGMGRGTAGKFSFIMSIPAILGASLLKIPEANLDISVYDVNNLFLGLFFAYFFGYIALRILLQFIAKGKLHWWAWYCYAVGIISLLYFGLASEETRFNVAEILRSIL